MGEVEDKVFAAARVFDVTGEMASAAYDPPAKIGDNRLLGTEQKKMLKGFLEELAANKAEQEQLKEHEKDIFESAKGAGFDVKVIKQIRKLIEMDDEEREEHLTRLEVYLHGAGKARPGME